MKVEDNDMHEDLSSVQSDENIPLEYEMVNQPKHYDFFGMTVIKVIEKTSTWEEYLGFIKGTAMRYRLRAGSKPGNSLEQDIAKAEWYENEYARIVEENNTNV